MGDHVNRTASGVYLTITESVAPFAVGIYEGPSIEILLYKSEWSRRNILEKYKKEILNFIDEDDVLENIYYTNKVGNVQSEMTDEIFLLSNNENIID